MIDGSRLGALRRSLVRGRDLSERIRTNLFFLPSLCVVVATFAALVLLRLDASSSPVPEVLRTTESSTRTVLSVIAGGGFTAVSILLTLTLVAVQLSASQFSPRNLGSFLGDRHQQFAIGWMLGVVVFCLLAIRDIGTRAEDVAFQVPELTSLVAVVGAVVGLLLLLAAVNRTARGLQIGTLVETITTDTIEVIERRLPVTPEPGAAHGAVGEAPTVAPNQPAGLAGGARPADAWVVESTESGWVQQLDEEAIAAAVPEDTTIGIETVVGGYVLDHAVLAWVHPAPPSESREAVERNVRAGFAIGAARTMQEDIGFGIVRLVDVALRALSPGINDPNTAEDVIVHLGRVLLSLWSRPIEQGAVQIAGRTVRYREQPSHGDYAAAALDQIRQHAAGSPSVASTLLRTIDTLIDEIDRRNLPGPVAPLLEQRDRLVSAVESADLLPEDRSQLQALASR